MYGHGASAAQEEMLAGGSAGVEAAIIIAPSHGPVN
jgi:hypothetical protein